MTENKNETQFCRSFVKIFVFFLCLGGFLYQSVTFLNIYWTYPTVVDIRIEYKLNMTMPSITVCNNNRLRRSVYCKARPENCEEKSSMEFCSDYPHLCGNGSSIYTAKREVFLESNKCNHSELQLYGHSITPLVTRFEILDSENYDFVEKKFNYIRISLSEGITCPRNCYALNSVVENSNFDFVHISLQTEERKIMKLFLDLEPEEYLDLSSSAEGYLAVHSPFKVLNPFIRGFKLQPGNIYYVDLFMEEKLSLQSPYRTNCRDYLKIWKEKNITGPFTWEMCVHHCKLTKTSTNCGCVQKRIIYPHNFPFCHSDDTCVSKLDLEACYSSCRQECISHSFKVSVTHKRIPDDLLRIYKEFYPQNVYNTLRNRCIILIFSVERPEFLLYQYLPKYEIIEVFSFIGGYLGMWLGISLFAIFNFLEDAAIKIFTKYENQKKHKKQNVWTKVLCARPKPFIRRKILA
ncbi:amiloride-sensitive sodium channel subunit gamma-like [Centruroides sculpturatus]|uniref:amiloride-sensitive sodium channel subunit gamma-like n=1 Tax=Centruroides sculpturatus TaxID=218467 RepID=UPI000C6CECCE|nr:amiloride-sensitive sodium channel subunit gamma-like [Centruroides sculpturatus]